MALRALTNGTPPHRHPFPITTEIQFIHKDFLGALVWPSVLHMAAVQSPLLNSKPWSSITGFLGHKITCACLSFRGCVQPHTQKRLCSQYGRWSFWWEKP